MPERIFRAAETFEIRWIVEEIRTVGYYNIRKLLLGGISFLGILIIAVSISLQTDIHLLTLLYSGFIPFLLLNAFTLHLYAHDQVLQVFLTVYGFAAGGLVLLELFGVGYWIGFLEQYGGQLFLAVLVYSGYVLWDHCRRNLHV